jgi:energy-coupling factor transporter ATP-binding protein EcfA2
VWGLRGFLRRSHTTDGLGGVPPPPTFNDKEMKMEYELKHGQALIITGPQGCGKSTLARRIAEAHGSFSEIDAARLKENVGLSEAMEGEPKTLIVEGIPNMSATEIKALITSKTVRVNRKHQMPKVVETPNFIFCSGDSDHLPLVAADRRFRVVELGTPA